MKFIDTRKMNGTERASEFAELTERMKKLMGKTRMPVETMEDLRDFLNVAIEKKRNGSKKIML